jgi:RNA polymerase sigma-70 factor (ECF subfamily)
MTRSPTQQLLPILDAGRNAPADALARILPDLLPKLRGFLAKRVSNAADVDDLAQDILLRVHQSAGQLGDETRILGWIWQIARDVVIDYYRSNGRGEMLNVDSLDLVSEQRPPDVEEIVASWLDGMIAALPQPYREAVQMSEIEGLSQTEVARRLSISLSGAKSRIQRGRAKLREVMTACCQFEFDREGRILGYRQVGRDCTAKRC